MLQLSFLKHTETITIQFWWPTHPVQNFRPALHGYTLEHRQHSEGEVVKVGDAIVGAHPSYFAHRGVSPTVASVGALGCTRCWLFLCDDFCEKLTKKNCDKQIKQFFFHLKRVVEMNSQSIFLSSMFPFFQESAINSVVQAKPPQKNHSEKVG